MKNSKLILLGLFSSICLYIYWNRRKNKKKSKIIDIHKIGEEVMKELEDQNIQTISNPLIIHIEDKKKENKELLDEVISQIEKLKIESDSEDSDSSDYSDPVIVRDVLADTTRNYIGDVIKNYNQNIPITFSRLFQKMKLKDIPTDSRSISVSNMLTVQDILEKLTNSDSRIASIQNNKQECIGIVDIFSITRYLLDINMSKIDHDIGSIISSSAVVKEDHNMLDVIELLKKNMRHVGVISELNKMVKVISQTSIIQYIYQIRFLPELVSMKEQLSLSIEDLDLYPSEKEIIIIDKNSSAKEAFLMMMKYQISSLPVVHDSKMVGVISMSDVKILAKKNTDIVRTMNYKIPKFVNKSREYVTNHIKIPNVEEIDLSPRPFNEIVICKPTTSLEVVLRMMLYDKVHHVYVVNQETYPIGVVSFVDILRTLVPVSKH